MLYTECFPVKAILTTVIFIRYTFVIYIEIKNNGSLTISKLLFLTNSKADHTFSLQSKFYTNHLSIAFFVLSKDYIQAN